MSVDLEEPSIGLGDCQLVDIKILTELPDGDFRRACSCNRRFYDFCNNSEATEDLYRERVLRWFPDEYESKAQLESENPGSPISWRRFYRALVRVSPIPQLGATKLERVIKGLGKQGRLLELRLIHRLYKNLDSDWFENALAGAAEAGRIQVLEWIVRKFGPNVVDNTVIEDLLKSTNPDAEAWVNSLLVNENAVEIGRAAAFRGNHRLIDTVLASFHLTEPEKMRIANEAAYSGRAETLKWLADTHGILPDYEELEWMISELGRPVAMINFQEDYF